MVRIAPIETNVNAIFVGTFSHKRRLRIQPKIWMFICTNVLLFEDNLYKVSLYFSRENYSFIVDGYIRVMKVIPSEHLQKQITSNCPYFSQILYLAGVLIGMWVNGRLQNYPHLISKVILDLCYFGSDLINFFGLSFHKVHKYRAL